MKITGGTVVLIAAAATLVVQTRPAWAQCQGESLLSQEATAPAPHPVVTEELVATPDASGIVAPVAALLGLCFAVGFARRVTSARSHSILSLNLTRDCSERSDGDAAQKKGGAQHATHRLYVRTSARGALAACHVESGP